MEQSIKQLLKEFNITNETEYGSKIALDANYISKLEKYDIQILKIVVQQLKVDHDGIYNAIIHRRRQGEKAKNMTCGFNVMKKCIDTINILILTKSEKECKKLYKEQIAILLKFGAAMFGILIILIIFEYAYFNL
jgi:hypothetical protein